MSKSNSSAPMKGDDVADGLDELLLLKCEYPAGIRGGQDFGACGDCAACRGAKEIRRLRSELGTERESFRHERAAMAAVNERLERELAELRGRGAGPVAGEEKDDEGRPYQCGAFVSGDGRWECVRESDHDGEHDWRIRAHPSVSAGERRIEGWASINLTDEPPYVRDDFCSCEKAGSWKFHADCGHVSTNQRATLTIHDSAVLPTPTEPAT